MNTNTINALARLADEHDRKAAAIRVVIAELSGADHASARAALPGKLRSASAIRAGTNGHGGPAVPVRNKRGARGGILQATLEALYQGGPMTRRAVSEQIGRTAADLAKLVKRGWMVNAGTDDASGLTVYGLSDKARAYIDANGAPGYIHPRLLANGGDRQAASGSPLTKHALTAAVFGALKSKPRQPDDLAAALGVNGLRALNGPLGKWRAERFIKRRANGALALTAKGRKRLAALAKAAADAERPSAE
jgi:hypothetical protein